MFEIVTWESIQDFKNRNWSWINGIKPNDPQRRMKVRLNRKKKVSLESMLELGWQRDKPLVSDVGYFDNRLRFKISAGDGHEPHQLVLDDDGTVALFWRGSTRYIFLQVNTLESVKAIMEKHGIEEKPRVKVKDSENDFPF